MSETLKPCPFCGATEDELMIFGDPEESASRRIQCAGCNVEAPFYPTKGEAIAAWNRRADGWQPIESAPKDGTKVLCGRFTGEGKNRDGYMAIDHYRGPLDGRGYVGFGQFNMTYWPPTHWQPLPAAPEVPS